jgi:hypothetical protein
MNQFGIRLMAHGYRALGGRLQIVPMGRGVSTYRGGNYCGPGWGFFREDAEQGKLPPAAFDVIDEACRIHDSCYERHGYFTKACNDRLAGGLGSYHHRSEFDSRSAGRCRSHGRRVSDRSDVDRSDRRIVSRPESRAGTCLAGADVDGSGYPELRTPPDEALKR